MAPATPTLAKFLSDFTLGFADGLTVPFALSAGLSSLGRSDTVIYAGIAEVCAGSISMGIGGYLSARDEARADENGRGNKRGPHMDDEETLLMGSGNGSPTGSFSDAASSNEKTGYGVGGNGEEGLQQHLRSLGVRPSTVEQAIADMRISGTLYELRRLGGDESRPAATFRDLRTAQAPSPVVSGLSVALGYAIGGLIPLVPYLFTWTVGCGLFWSIVVCVLALFWFGYGKALLLHEGDEARADDMLAKRRSKGQLCVQWRCILEGAQMVAFGSVAAGAAVGCVKLLEGNVGEVGS
ncbi:hypothetical protein MKZ38_004286 [Zalerion maritima]|uniref:Iron transporter n=1 Tax=Zalerion maritima TaxID=339359 RepID=A0AAD5RMX1_9PEZI|nr:hypothetical protein MKZ38_004286 [Zalerion maritima]